MGEPLILQKKTEVVLNRDVYPTLQNFPKAEKFGLCQEIKQAFYRVLRNTMLANTSRRGDVREQRFREVDADLKLILVLFSIAREQKYITEKKSLQLQERVSELGKITGGLIKNAQGMIKGQSSMFDSMPT
ncbi:MAG: four helix bundle protein [Oscillospiraceae bacterium]|jgi:hypothetical protein|nr:four helix bundle protein [Oscillospiraceae bacterium]